MKIELTTQELIDVFRLMTFVYGAKDKQEAFEAMRNAMAIAWKQGVEHGMQCEAWARVTNPYGSPEL